MTAIQLRAELFREMSPLLDSEIAMKKMLSYIRTLAPAKKMESENLNDNERLNAALSHFHKDWGGNGNAMTIAKELRGNVENNRTVEDW
jgi:hypothetical protein